CCCAAVFGVITLKPDATSMLSRFCVLVCVLAQPTNSAMHAAAILLRKIRLAGFIGRIVAGNNNFLTKASEGNSSGDLRAVPDNVETKIVFLEVTGKCPITNLSKDGTGEVDTEHALDLPHQVSTNSESSDLATHGGVIRFVKIVSATQSDIGIEPVIIS